MTKATTNGVYILNGHRFIMQAGQVLPDGAEIEGATVEPETVDDAPVERKKPAPENRKKAAPENRSE